jgi:hypothetical protein
MVVFTNGVFTNGVLEFYRNRFQAAFQKDAAQRG